MGVLGELCGEASSLVVGKSIAGRLLWCPSSVDEQEFLDFQMVIAYYFWFGLQPPQLVSSFTWLRYRKFVIEIWRSGCRKSIAVSFMAKQMNP